MNFKIVQLLIAQVEACNPRTLHGSTMNEMYIIIVMEKNKFRKIGKIKRQEERERREGEGRKEKGRNKKEKHCKVLLTCNSFGITFLQDKI